MTAAHLAASSSSLLPVNRTLGIVLALLLVAATAVAGLGKLGYGRAIVRAGSRAAVQLAVVSFVIAFVVRSLPLLLLFVLLMFSIAARTAGRRITPGPGWWWAAVPIAAGVLPVLAALLLTGLVPLKGISLIPVAGILIGGGLTATTLAGRRALDELWQRRGEVEAALSLGLADREARLEISREAGASSLIPALDQTRTVGLVTLPGAFVGVLLGGAKPLAAGAVQLFVLIALLLVETVAVLATLELVARGRLTRPPGSAPSPAPLRDRLRSGMARFRYTRPSEGE